MLVIVCGLQGTGKTTVAKSIAKKTGAVLLRTDVIRKELIKNPDHGKEEIVRIYREMFSRAKMLLEDNKSVILDATFAEEHDRDGARKLAEVTGSGFELVEVVCSSEEMIKARLNARSGDASEAKYEQYLAYKKLFEPIDQKHVIIDNSGGLEEIERQVEVFFG